MLKRDKIFFDHIPKTGGSSLHAIFEKLFGASNVSPVILFERFTVALKKYGSSKLLQGHFVFFPSDTFDISRFSVTLLRHPVDRALSHYFFYRFDVPLRPGGYSEGVALAKNLEPVDFFFSDNPLVTDMSSNSQTRHFMQLEWDGATELSESEQLELAKKALLRYDLVGVYHQFMDFVDVLCYECGWPPVKSVPHVNVTSKRPKMSEVDPRIIKRLEELNQADMALYEFVTKLFNEKKRQMIVTCLEQRYREAAISTVTHKNEIKEEREAKEQVESIAITPNPYLQKATKPASADFGNRRLEIIDITVTGTTSLGPLLFSGENATIRVLFRAHESVENLTVGILIYDHFGRPVFGTNSRCLGYQLSVRAGGVYFVDYAFRNDLGMGRYTVSAALHLGDNHLIGCFHWRDQVAQFEVVGDIGYHSKV